MGQEVQEEAQEAEWAAQAREVEWEAREAEWAAQCIDRQDRAECDTEATEDRHRRHQDIMVVEDGAVVYLT